MSSESTQSTLEFSNLGMILPKSHQDIWWFIDLVSLCCHSLNASQIIRLCNQKAMLIVAPDAKKTLVDLKIPLKPDLRWLCLSTVKKLMGKAGAVEVPEFNDEKVAISWAEQATKSALQKISQANVAHLVALESQVIVATTAMQQAGLPFIKEQWQDALDACAIETQNIKKSLEKYFVKHSGFALFGPEPLDLNNAVLVKEGLEEILGTKLASTSQSTLKNYDHEAVKLLLRYREQARMLSTYGENFLAKVTNNRIHAIFEPLGSASGRFACHNPNLQALPNDAVFQACIKALHPNKLIYFDYGAFELRILAALSGDKKLIDIFLRGQDIHSMVAEAIFKCPVSKTENSHLRNQAKILNFGIVYGMGERSLAEQLKISSADAAMMMKGYFEHYKDVKDFLLNLEKNAVDEGFVNTALGRRLIFAGLNNDEKSVRRIARNMPIQGTGADIAKLALCRVFNRIFTEKIDARVVNIVHDELVVECHETICENVIELVVSEMNKAFNAILPNLAADIGVVIS